MGRRQVGDLCCLKERTNDTLVMADTRHLLEFRMGIAATAVGGKGAGMVSDYLGPYLLGPNDTPENGVSDGLPTIPFYAGFDGMIDRPLRDSPAGYRNDRHFYDESLVFPLHRNGHRLPDRVFDGHTVHLCICRDDSWHFVRLPVPGFFSVNHDSAIFELRLWTEWGFRILACSSVLSLGNRHRCWQSDIGFAQGQGIGGADQFLEFRLLASLTSKDIIHDRL